jgi:hypothetical protein
MPLTAEYDRSWGAGMGESDRMKQASETRRDGGRKGHAADSLGTNSEIGRKLKQYYDGLIADDVPDRFTQLLEQLAKSDDKADKAKSSSDRD